MKATTISGYTCIQMGSASKRQERVDRISELPNPVLSRILSLLETREAVHTTLLSKRWENLWTSLSNLEFRGTYFPTNVDRVVCDRFMTFVDHVVSSHDSTDIRKFILLVHFDGNHEHEYFPRIHSWIITAVRHNVVEVELTLFNKKETFQFPQSLFTCKTLKVLKVQSDCITYAPPTSGCFPSLKVLNVTVGCPDHSAENLSSCCPVLEDLTIDGCHAVDVLDINISAPELKDLLIHLELPMPVYGFDCPNKCYINAPKLESLDLFREITSSDFVFENAKSLGKAKIWCDDDPDEYPDRVNALLASISSVRSLCLSIPSFFKDSILPAFENLIHLELVVCDHDYWELLIQVLKTSSTLKHFVFRNQAIMYDEEHEIEWNSGNQLDVVPICVSSHLKCITMYQFKGQRDEMKVAEYLLKNGLVLDMMTIYTERPRTSIDHCGWLYSIEELYEKFSLFEKGSKTCEVQITCKDDPRCYFLDDDL